MSCLTACCRRSGEAAATLACSSCKHPPALPSPACSTPGSARDAFSRMQRLIAVLMRAAAAMGGCARQTARVAASEAEAVCLKANPSRCVFSGASLQPPAAADDNSTRLQERRPCKSRMHALLRQRFNVAETTDAGQRCSCALPGLQKVHAHAFRAPLPRAERKTVLLAGCIVATQNTEARKQASLTSRGRRGWCAVTRHKGTQNAHNDET